MIWSEQTIPQRVATMQRNYERIAKNLYPDGTPMDAYKTDPKRHDLYQNYLSFARQLGTILEKNDG
jgi:hypothetical protein